MGGCTALKARRLAKLMSIDPHCWYCGCGLLWKLPGEGSIIRPNVGVIEAELSRCETGTQPKGARTYLSCYECADERAKYEFFIFKMWNDAYWAQWRADNGKPSSRTNKERRAETVLLGPDPHEEGAVYDGC